MDLIVRNARLLGLSSTVDIAVKDGKIAKVSTLINEKAESEIDARGNLVLPSFVEPHVHLDKALLALVTGEAKSLAEAREKVKQAKTKFTKDDVRKRAESVLQWCLENGVTFVRTHVDVDSIVRTKSLEALLELKTKFKGLLELDIVAFPQEGVVKEDAKELLIHALEQGANVLGGLPEAELTREDGITQIELLFEIAKSKNVDLDVHLDVSPYTNFVEQYVSHVIKQGYQGKATADHLIALSYYSNSYASRVIQLLKQAQVNVVSNPCTSITVGASDPPPIGRGITRVKELLDSGVNVCFGLDNVVDPYNPFGDFDPLRNAWLLSYLGQLNREKDFEALVKMPTYFAARVLRLNGYGLDVGCNADFNVIDAKDLREALRKAAKPKFVVKQGKIILERNTELIWHRSLP
jgi:cytosine deaminase